MNTEEKYIVSARKYRPTTFDMVVGQSAIAETLKNAIHTGKLAHAYLFCGPRGVGKTTCARIFAKTINCFHPKENGEACEECESCRAFNEQRSLNIHELDAASNNSVDDIRTLIEQVQIPPQIGKYKVFIIDEVHMLSTSAFNAFLKTLEEPPAHAIFILATTEKHKILPTILSRCQVYDFQRMSVTDIVNHLANVAQKEGYTAEPAALNIIAQKADGGMRDALSIFDQTASFCGGNITYQKVIENLNVLDYDYYFRLVDDMLEQKIPEALLLFNEILNKGFDGAPFISGLATHLRDVLVSHDEQTAGLLEVSDDIRARYVAQAKRCKPQWLYKAIRLCNNCDQAYRTSRNKRLQVELTIIECAQAVDDDGSAGRRPTLYLKPIFSRLFAEADKRVATAANQSQAKPQTNQPLPNQPLPNPLLKEREPANAAASLAQDKPKVLNLGNMVTSIFAPAPASSPTAGAETAPIPSPQVSEPQPLVSEYSATSFTQNDLLIHWQAFIQTMPVEETAMAQRMTLLRPTLMAEGSTDVVVTVSNVEVSRMLQELLPQILKFLRLRLRNSNLNIQIRVAERNEQTQHHYDKASEWHHLVKDNPIVAALHEHYHLELE